MFAHGETVVRLRAPMVFDPYSATDTLAEWDDEDNPPSELPLHGVGVADGGSIEPEQDARNSVESDFDVIVAAGTDVLPTDRLRIRGLVCEVQGRPFDWLNPFTGWQPGMVVKAKIVEG